MSKIVIGDVHGSHKTLLALVDKILADGNKLEDICFVGDLVDRGPSSKQVVDYIIKNKLPCVLGNHEQMMIDYDNKDEWEEGIWLINGGAETLESYDYTIIDKWGDTKVNNEVAFEQEFKDHVAFFKTLPLYLEFPEEKVDGRHLVISHSNVGKVWDWSPEKREQMKDAFKQNIIWERTGQEDQPDIFNIVGHTPKPMVVQRSFYANVDTGACFSHNPNYGYLSALKFPEMKVYTAKNIDND